MRITLFGATGGVGGYFLIKSLAKKYDVKSCYQNTSWIVFFKLLCILWPP